MQWRMPCIECRKSNAEATQRRRCESLRCRRTLSSASNADDLKETWSLKVAGGRVQDKMRTVRLGIIGTGLMGREIASSVSRWCHLLNPPAAVQLTAVCGRSQSGLRWFQRNFPTLEQVTTDYRKLVDNPAVDAVYCAVPHHLHQEFYIAVMRSGKHLLGEKPFGIDIDANAAIVTEAKHHEDLVVRCASEFPFFPGAQRIVAMSAAGRFGRLLEVDGGFLHGSDLDPNKPIGWKRQAAYNGEYGCMGDLGMHVLHIPLRCGWHPRNVRAVLTNVYEWRPDQHGTLVSCDTWDNATLFCDAGMGADRFPLTIKLQRIAPGETNTWYLSVNGTRGGARFSTEQPRTLETLSYTPGRDLPVWQTEDLGYETLYPTITGRIFEFGFSDAILQMLASFCAEIVDPQHETATIGCVTPDETRFAHEILTAALRSNRETATVDLDLSNSDRTT